MHCLSNAKVDDLSKFSSQLVFFTILMRSRHPIHIMNQITDGHPDHRIQGRGGSRGRRIPKESTARRYFRRHYGLHCPGGFRLAEQRGRRRGMPQSGSQLHRRCHALGFFPIRFLVDRAIEMSNGRRKHLCVRLAVKFVKLLNRRSRPWRLRFSAARRCGNRMAPKFAGAHTSSSSAIRAWGNQICCSLLPPWRQ